MAVIRKIKLPSEAAARDIGALSSNVIYNGDSGVTTTLNDKIQSIFTAIGDINSFEIALVNALPTENIDDHTIYFVPNSQDANTRDEYMYVGNQWEMIGSTTIDLSDYPTYDDISVVQGLTTGIPAATITVGSTTTTIYSADANALTPTLDDRYVNVTGDTMTGNLKVASTTTDRYTEIAPDIIVLNTGTTLYGGVRLETFNAVNHVGLDIVSTKGSDVKTEIRGITTPESANEYHAASKGYVDSKINTVTSTIPTVTPVAALTTGITIGSIDVSGTTTTFYAPDDKKYTVPIEIGEYNADDSSYHSQIYDINFVNDQDSIDTIKQKILDGYTVEVTDGYALYHLTGFESNSEYTAIEFSQPNVEGTDIIEMYKDLETLTLNRVFNPCNDDVWYQPYTGFTPGISGKLHAGNDSWDITYQDAHVTMTSENTVGGASTSGTFPILYSNQTSTNTDGVYKSSKVNLKQGSILELIDNNNNSYTAQYSPQSIKYYSTYTRNNKKITDEVEIQPNWGSMVSENGASCQTTIGTKYNLQIIPVGSSDTIGSPTIPVYVSNYEILPCTLPTIPSITATAGLTTGVTIGAININGVTTTFYTPEDTKVKQNDITGSTTTEQYPILLSDTVRQTTDTVTSETLKSGKLIYNANLGTFMVSGNGNNYNGGFYINDYESRHNQASLIIMTAGTTSTVGVAGMQLGNQYSLPEPGNAKGVLVICGEGNWQNQLYTLDNRTTEGSTHNYKNYLPMTDGVLAAGVTTGVGSSTVPVYMASTGELLACTLPTSASYSLSMTGPTIFFTSEQEGEVSRVTLPIWDGTLD